MPKLNTLFLAFLLSPLIFSLPLLAVVDDTEVDILEVEAKLKKHLAAIFEMQLEEY